MLSHFLILFVYSTSSCFSSFVRIWTVHNHIFDFFFFFFGKTLISFASFFQVFFLFFFVIFSAWIFLYVNFINMIMIYIIHKILLLLKIKCFFSSIIGLFSVKKVIIFFHKIKWWKAQGLRKIEISKNT